MARVNYAFEKRQRDLAKKQKKEEKRLKKARASGDTAQPEGDAPATGTGEATPPRGETER